MTTIRICDRCGARIDVDSTSIFINGIWHVGYKKIAFCLRHLPIVLRESNCCISNVFKRRKGQ